MSEYHRDIELKGDSLTPNQYWASIYASSRLQKLCVVNLRNSTYVGEHGPHVNAEWVYNHLRQEDP
jgi:hypothetical protein